MPQRHILYSFRRCPYAMRGRMGLYAAGIAVELRELILRDKPAHMLEISPKGTVPVLQTTDGAVIDESLDIMLWALEQNDPQGWLNADRGVMMSLIAENDGPFKYALDRYKYPGRYPDEDCSTMRETGFKILTEWNKRIANNKGGLMGDKIALPDIAIFPFVRQFAHTDREWFFDQNIPALQNWLTRHLDSDLFQSIMIKCPLWQDGDDPFIFGPTPPAPYGAAYSDA